MCSKQNFFLRLLQSEEETFCDWSIWLIWKPWCLTLTPKFRTENLKKHCPKCQLPAPHQGTLRLFSSDKANHKGAESSGLGLLHSPSL